MSSNLFENEFTKVQIIYYQKKPSREERKLQQAIRLIDKMEGNTQKPQNKKRNHTNTLLLNSQPKKKVKIEMLNYEPQSSSVNINQIQSSNPSSVVQQSSKPKKEKTVINQDYLNGQKQDLYSHLLQYELNEKQKYFEILHGDPLEIEKLPTAEGQFNFFSIDTVAKTNRAYQKIKERFQQGKNKLIRATSKEHKEFNSQFLKLDYLLN